MTLTPERIKQIEDAHAEMQRRGWGFVSIGNPNAQGFGDPATPITGVGPYDGLFVAVLAHDRDCVRAVRKAVKVYERGTR